MVDDEAGGATEAVGPKPAQVAVADENEHADPVDGRRHDPLRWP